MDTSKSLEKIDSIIKRDIERLTFLCRKTSYHELSCFLCWLHIARGVANRTNDEHNKQFDSLWITTSLIDESLKYLVQCSAKFGTIGQVNNQNYHNLNLPLAQYLLKLANRINTKYNSRELASQFYSSIEGDRVIVDYTKPLIDIDSKKYFDYFQRTELINEYTKMNALDLHLPGLLTKFYEQQNGNDDLFRETFGVSLQTYIDLHEYLATSVINNLKNKESQMPMKSPGFVDVQTELYFLLYTESSYLSVSEIRRKFGGVIIPIIERLTFQPNIFDENQLRYHQLDRKPLIGLQNGAIQVCPDFLFDSLFINSHYTLLENQPSVSEEYKKRGSEIFINRIATICAKHGFIEMQRNVDLFDGKRSLGDIDLIVKNINGKYLLIEAKNHALPLNVYFYNFAAAKEHLETLKLDWERPLINRIKHLEEFADKYDIHSPYQYLVVSRTPEIISHFSDNLFLSIYEFERWLENGANMKQFSDIFQTLFQKWQEPTAEDVRNFQNAGFWLPLSDD